MKKYWFVSVILLSISILICSSTVVARNIDKPEIKKSEKPIKKEKKGDFIYEYYRGSGPLQLPSEKEIAQQQGVKNIPVELMTLSNYDNTDPVVTGCYLDAVIAYSTYIRRASDNLLVGTIQLRYSPSCQTAWGRLTVEQLDFLNYGQATLMRQEGNYYELKDVAYVTPGYTNYTNQFSDAGTVSYAHGLIVSRDNQSFDAKTLSY